MDRQFETPGLAEKAQINYMSICSILLIPSSHATYNLEEEKKNINSQSCQNGRKCTTTVNTNTTNSFWSNLTPVTVSKYCYVWCYSCDNNVSNMAPARSLAAFLSKSNGKNSNWK